MIERRAKANTKKQRPPHPSESGEVPQIYPKRPGYAHSEDPEANGSENLYRGRRDVQSPCRTDGISEAGQPVTGEQVESQVSEVTNRQK